MRAITVTAHGNPPELSFAEVPDPVAAPGELVIDVVASAVNRADLLQRQGNYPPPPGASEYLGLECSGRIIDVGDGVPDWTVGDEVCALLAGGGYAERVAVPAGQLLPVPAGVSVAEAAALPEAVCTVWSNLFSVARLIPGEILLVHGGSGGIGSMAIQLAAAYGARVLCTARSENANACRAYGAEQVVDYRNDDFVRAVGEFSDGHGVDVILDVVGAKYLARNIEALAVGGRLAVVGLQGGRKAEIDLRLLMNKRARITGTTLRSRPLEEKASIVTDVREHVWPLIEAQWVRPIIAKAFALADAEDAHRYLEQGGHVGKVLLVR